MAQQAMCTVCRSRDLRTVLPLGEQPPSNRFLSPSAPSVTDERYPLSLGQCRVCHTIQLVDRMPIEAVRPRYDWLSYNEPEGHLDDVAARIAALPGVRMDSRILGVTYKDRSTLDRMIRLGFTRTAALADDDLKAPVRPFGLETIQRVLSDESTIRELRTKYGESDVVIFRHVVEHSPDAARFIRSMRGLLAPGGYLVFEVPDSERVLRAGNHAFIWEEHVSYFTSPSLGRLAEEVGATMVWLGQYPYPYEDSLVAVLRFDVTGQRKERVNAPEERVTLELASFAAALGPSRTRWREMLEGHRAGGRRVAVFGAGHLSAKFVNFLEIADLIDCVVDDHPRKVGLLMPGSHLPIIPSADLSKRTITVCISTLSPESELKVKSKLSAYFESGGTLEPAFAIA
jgi:SAM-dependent methyltransferase